MKVNEFLSFHMKYSKPKPTNFAIGEKISQTLHFCDSRAKLFHLAIKSQFPQFQNYRFQDMMLIKQGFTQQDYNPTS